MIITGAPLNIRYPAILPKDTNLASALTVLAHLIVPEFVYSGTPIEFSNTAAFKFTILSKPLSIVGTVDEVINNLNMCVSFIREGTTYTYLLYPALPNDALFHPLYQGETIEPEFTITVSGRTGVSNYACDGFQLVLREL